VTATDFPTIAQMPDGFNMEHTSRTVASNNAYYVGNEVLESLAITQAQLCIGGPTSSDACSVSCTDLDDSHAGVSVDTHFPGSTVFSSQLKKMIACLTGQCAGDAYTDGSFYRCTSSSVNYPDCCSGTVGFSSSYSSGSWNLGGEVGYCNAAGGHVANAYNGAIHFWSSGFSMGFPLSGDGKEIGCMTPDTCAWWGKSTYTGNGGEPTIWQIRWK